MGLLLYIFASIMSRVLFTLFITLTVVKYLITFKWKVGWKKVNGYFYHMAFGKDQYGNVVLKVPMNSLLRKKGAKFFYGDEDDTISYATAMNYFKGSSTGFGRWIGRSLNKAEERHMEKAINNKIKRDMAGFERLVKAGFIEGNIEIEAVNEESYWKYVKHITNERRELNVGDNGTD